jgi:hypothetical protein|tara:strand:- start:83 stop:1141 length:1059 start_codon:yes stop_codon:yes gene_type:complete
MSRSRELADFLVASGNKLELKGDAGEDGCIKKNDASGRDEMQIYSGSDAYSTGSKGAGIHLYGNSDSQHNGDMAFLTGPNDNGNARIIISGHEDKARVTIGNSTSSRSIWDFVDLNEDPALLNLKDASSQPALYIKGASASEGDITCPPADAMQFGHWEIDTSSADYGFTERFRMDTSGNLKIADGNLIIGTAGHGIDFSATSDGSTMSSELLDDYEEGIFTPILYGNTTGSGTVLPLSSNHNRLAYTKIGRQVTVTGKIETSGSHSASGYLKLSLPFAVADLDKSSGIPAGVVFFYRTGDGLHTNPVFLPSEGNAHGLFYQNTSGGDADTIDAQNMDTSIEFFLTVTYFTT